MGWVSKLFLRVVNQSHFIFEINFGKSRIRHITTLNLNDISSIDFESMQKFIILFQSRCMLDSTLSDIDFKNKRLESELPLTFDLKWPQILNLSFSAPLVLAFIVLTIWIFVAAPYDDLRYETRTVLALTGVVFANIAVSNIKNWLLTIEYGF